MSDGRRQLSAGLLILRLRFGECRRRLTWSAGLWIRHRGRGRLCIARARCRALLRLPVRNKPIVAGIAGTRRHAVGLAAGNMRPMIRNEIGKGRASADRQPEAERAYQRRKSLDRHSDRRIVRRSQSTSLADLCFVHFSRLPRCPAFVAGLWCDRARAGRPSPRKRPSRQAKRAGMNAQSRLSAADVQRGVSGRHRTSLRRPANRTAN